MGALDYFTADAVIVGAAVTRDPATMFNHLFARLSVDGEIEGLDDELLALRDDLLAALGGEIAVGIDGALLPEPSWKFVVEVYDSLLLQHTLEALVERANEELSNRAERRRRACFAAVLGGWADLPRGHCPDRKPMTAAPEMPVTFTFTFADGYLIAAPSEGVIDRAISTAGSNTSTSFSRRPNSRRSFPWKATSTSRPSHTNRISEGGGRPGGRTAVDD